MHNLIIASSTNLQISATLHKLLPVHLTGHMLGVQIFEKLLTVCGAHHIYVQYLGDMQKIHFIIPNEIK